MVLRDDTGAIIFSSCRQRFSCREASEVELCACMKGVSLALQWCQVTVIIEVDALEVVNMIQNSDNERSIYASLVLAIKTLMSCQICITHVNRSQNTVRHSLANYARIEGKTGKF